MNLQCEEFFYLITKISNEAKRSSNELMLDWLPEKPPITILFSAIGYSIAESFDSNDVLSNQTLFALIENGVSSDDLMLGTAVATGLIEGMVTRAQQIDGLWERMAPSLGQGSLQHATAWLNG